MAKKTTSLSQKADDKLDKLNGQLRDIRKSIAKLKADEAAKVKEIKEAEGQRLSERSAGIGKALAEKGIDMNKLNEALKSNTELLNMLLGVCGEDKEEPQEKEEPAPETADSGHSDEKGKEFKIDFSS